MNISLHCPISLAPAQPGWCVRNTDPEGVGIDYPIVAWAIVAVGAEDGSTDTDIQPVFIADGHPWTVVDWYAANGDEHNLSVAES
ncbi:hypothetical protein AQF52_4396 [Streptomyces venezuelae]|uniref:hypothetical protein n=1 Tax=Streptomyces gardneri TaxID=66892 RepID=UPI0006BDCF88|nr:hypothetical protein [Streptomyces gardneri]ALO09990.1 hypothetical protein AQF52_4396 [Streptomyces venezuelae]QPK47029.1 hypothetical protein H4W23_22055 [Streptomyces gardneri]WRK38446.1 hypothetical protein U0M97_22155 [Streptomyces venezuelae]CUM39564.1 hypothetical protein BN2537_8093 [Streptomyces venezuelae]